MRATALTLCIALTGCTFGVKHPAITAGIVGGVVGLGTCEIGTGFDLADGKTQGQCGLIAGGAGLLLGGIVALAVVLGGEGHTVLVQDDQPPPLVRDKKQPEPAPTTPAPTP
jgi:hypothetical protein